MVCRAALRLSLWDDAPQALITYVQSNKANDNDWFTVRSRCPPERPPHCTMRTRARDVAPARGGCEQLDGVRMACVWHRLGAYGHSRWLMSGPQRCGTPQISSNKEGTKWTGKCWYVHNLLKYEFDLQFDIPVRLPANTPLACHGQNVLVPLFLCWRRRQMGWSLVGWVVCSSRLVQPLLVLSIFTAPCQTLTVRFATLFAFDQAQVTYPATAPELELPELDGKTSKMFRGGKICLTIHFKPLWSKNVPHFGIAHALCLGLGPWMVRSVTRQAEKEK